MWATLISDITSRCLSCRSYFSAVCGLNPPPTGGGIPPATHQAVTTAKGLMFVQLYAVYENTVVKMVQSAIGDILNHAVPVSDIKLELLSLTLHPEISAVIDSGSARQWNARKTLMLRINSANPTNVPDTVFPNDGSHFRRGQLQTIWDIFGVSQPLLPIPRHLGRVDELVEHRNAIAHGRRTAEDIGRRFSVGDINDRIDDTELICLHLATSLQTHCSTPANYRR